MIAFILSLTSVESHTKMISFSSIALKSNVVPTSAVIFLHGLGDVGESWTSFFNPLKQELNQTLFLFPNAPQRAVSINNGLKMTAWYDIFSFDQNAIDDKAGFEDSSKSILSLIESLNKNKNIPYDKIILGGFSQGGAVSLYTALKDSLKLAGLIVLSGYLPFSKSDFKVLNSFSLPMFIGHGESDPLISCSIGKMTAQKLKESGFSVTLKTYPNMGHSISQKEEIDVHTFILNLLTV